MTQSLLNTDTILITPELLVLIAGIDEFKGTWRALGTLAPERLSALRRVATIESIGSSTRIEGSKLSDRDVERLLANLEVKSFVTCDEQEVRMGDIIKLTGASRNTLKQQFRQLVDKRHLVKHGGGRTTWYTLP